tara:strand:- start:743 stop:919 length:177 start_codon:yes stop_codon:yes gene_type:complete
MNLLEKALNKLAEQEGYFGKPKLSDKEFEKQKWINYTKGKTCIVGDKYGRKYQNGKIL